MRAFPIGMLYRFMNTHELVKNNNKKKFFLLIFISERDSIHERTHEHNMGEKISKQIRQFCSLLLFLLFFRSFFLSCVSSVLFLCGYFSLPCSFLCSFYFHFSSTHLTISILPYMHIMYIYCV